MLTMPNMGASVYLALRPFLSSKPDGQGISEEPAAEQSAEEPTSPAQPTGFDIRSYDPRDISLSEDRVDLSSCARAGLPELATRGADGERICLVAISGNS